MIKPTKPENESERLKALRKFNILDSEAEKEFDDLVLLASKICETPISLVSLIDEDRQWFKSKVGLEATETHRDLSFCGHAINETEKPFIIEDSREDERFYDNPLVRNDPNVIFYAGIPIKTSDGKALGTLCVIDDKPKKLSESQVTALNVLSNQVMKMIELRYNNKLLSQLNESLSLKNKEIENFAHHAAHDLKSPLNSISQIITLIIDEKKSLSEDIVEYIELIGDCSDNLSNLIAQLLELAKADNLIDAPKSKLSIDVIKSSLNPLIAGKDNVRLNIETELTYLIINKIVCFKVLHNLVSNSIKYNDKEQTKIIIVIEEGQKDYIFYVKDNGPGILKEKAEDLFKPFKILTEQDKFGNKGTGLGLSSVKNLLEKLNCTINLEGEKEVCNTFKFNLPKGTEAELYN